MMIQGRRSNRAHWAALAVAVALAGSVALPGCGGGSSGSSPVSSSTPRPPVRNVIIEETFSDLRPFDPSEDAFFLAFVTGGAGTLDITVDWTHSSNDLDFLLARGTLEQALSPACQDENLADCPLELVMTAESFAKPETMTVANAAPGNYVLAVVNFGTTNEAGVVVIGLTTTAATAPGAVLGVVGSTTTSSAWRALPDDRIR